MQQKSTYIFLHKLSTAKIDIFSRSHEISDLSDRKTRKGRCNSAKTRRHFFASGKAIILVSVSEGICPFIVSASMRRFDVVENVSRQWGSFRGDELIFTTFLISTNDLWTIQPLPVLIYIFYCCFWSCYGSKFAGEKVKAVVVYDVRETCRRIKFSLVLMNLGIFCIK